VTSARLRRLTIRQTMIGAFVFENKKRRLLG
jgi:hypothetical protein